MRLHDLRLAPAAAAAIVASVSAARGVPWAWLSAAALAVASFALAVRFVGPRGVGRAVSTTAAACAALVAVVCGAAAFRTDLATPASVRDAWADGGQATIWGRVASEPTAAARDPWTGLARHRWTVSVDTVAGPGSDPQWPVRWSVTVVAQPSVEPPALGERVRVVGWLPATPDATGAAVVWAEDAEVTAGAGPVWRAVAAVRSAAREATSGLPDGVRDLTLGMVIGDTSAMSPALQADMRATSLTHLTAVSGSHFAIVVVAVGALLRRATGSRRLRAAALAAAMVSLAAVVGAEPSVVRALTMALAVAAGWWWGRPAAALPALSAGVIVMLLWDPGLGARLGFHLSVTAVTAIVLWAPVLARHLRRWCGAPLAHALSVPAAAYAACWPLLVGVDPRLAAYAVPANLVAALAAIPVTTVGLGATMLSLVWPAGGAALMQAAGAAAWPVVWAARGFASAPGSTVPWPAGGGGQLLACAVVALALAATALRRAGPAWRAALALVAAVASLVGPGLGADHGPVADDWAIVVCDVGQGDAMLVRAGRASAVMIDTGQPGAGGAQCLERYGIDDIPLLILTHPHADHDGALAEVAAVARLGTVWVSPVTAQDGLGDAAGLAADLGAQVRTPVPGDAVTVGAATVRVWSPPAGVSASDSAEINDASIVVAVASGSVTALALGDLEEDGQQRLAADLAGRVTVDVLKVAHHGAAAQSDALLGLIDARVAAISVGEDNAYGHPAASTVARLATVASLVLTTAQCGDIAVREGGQVASRCHADVAG